MSRENVQIVGQAYEQFRVTGRFAVDLASADFVWDMTNFSGWPEQQVYEGIAGAERFLEGWMSAWDDWEIHVDALRDAGEQVVALLHQHGVSKATGMPVEMAFAQVWTVRDGKEVRMDMYSDQAEALRSAGVGE